MNRRYGLLAVMLLSACASSPKPLVVKQFLLRDQVPGRTDDPMVRMEKERRLHGAVSMAERSALLGQYYTLIWSDPTNVGNGEVELVFEYQQGATASRIKRITRSFPASESHGTVELAVIGEDYTKGGRVLAWKATVSRGKRHIASQQSYLWQ